MIWNDDSIALLEKLWNNGLSTTEIAKKMNVSKNAIVGKVHRLCLKARPSPIKKKNDEIKAKITDADKKAEIEVEVEIEYSKDVTEEKPKKVKSSAKTDAKQTSAKATKSEIATNDKNSNNAESAPAKKNIKLVELDSHTCRWPIGDPREENFCFCGKKVRAGQTYCDEHSQIAYIKALSK